MSKPRKSGRCVCDDPEIETVAAVRKFAKSISYCWWCGDRGLDLMRFGWERMHVRCLYRKLKRSDGPRLGVKGYRLFAVLEMHQRRVRLCCLGPANFRRLLHHTRDDGGRAAPAQDWR